MTNVQKLIAHKMSIDAIPPGVENPLASGIAYLTKPGLPERARAAEKWVRGMVLLARCSRGLERVGLRMDSTDEEIAGVILKKIEERTAAQRRK